MKHNFLILSCLLYSFCDLHSMDPVFEEDDEVLDNAAFSGNTNKATFSCVFPELTVVHIYPIQLYNPKPHRYATVRRQFCFKKKYGSHCGRFFIYTAVDKKEWTENPGYCLQRIEQDLIAKADHEKIVGYNYGKLSTQKSENKEALTQNLEHKKEVYDTYMLWHKHNFMSEKENNDCNTTLEKYIDCFKHKHAVFIIGPCISCEFRAYPEVYTLGCALKLDTQKVRKKTKDSSNESDYLQYDTDEFDLRQLYEEWPEHGSKQLLRKAIDEREGVSPEFKPIEFIYSASPSSSPESSRAYMLDVQLQTVSDTKTRKFKLT